MSKFKALEATFRALALSQAAIDKMAQVEGWKAKLEISKPVRELLARVSTLLHDISLLSTTRLTRRMYATLIYWKYQVEMAIDAHHKATFGHCSSSDPTQLPRFAAEWACKAGYEFEGI